MLAGCRDPLNRVEPGGQAVVTGCHGQALGEMDSASEETRERGRWEVVVDGFLEVVGRRRPRGHPQKHQSPHSHQLQRGPSFSK